MKKLFFTSLLFITSLTCANELVVNLESQEACKIAYVSSLQSDAPDINSSEIKALYDAFIFDLKHCGYLSLLEQNPSAETQLKKTTAEDAFDPNFWSQQKARFIIRCQIQDQALSVQLFDHHTCVLKKFAPVKLTGLDKQDRHTVHLITDAMHSLMLEKKGISTMKLLFAKQMPIRKGGQVEWNSEIWECDYDGKNQVRLTHENGFCMTPIAVPGSTKQYLYVNYKLGQSKIFVNHTNTKHGVHLLPLRGNQLLPSFSSDGKTIAFISDATGRADLFVQKINLKTGQLDKPIQAYSFPKSVQASPTFNPNGTKIAFVSDKEGSPRIYIINTPLKGGMRPEALCLTCKYRENTCPAWSPDGTKLAYSARVDNTRQIMIYDFEKNTEIQLTTGKGHKENPSWAPNSLHLVFNQIEGHNSELYLTNLHDKEVIKITDGPGKKHFPVWRY